MADTVASSAARNIGTASTQLVLTMGAAVQTGDWLGAIILNRSDETTTITDIDDSVNGTSADWTLISGPTNSTESTYRTWAYKFENSAAGTPVLTVDFSGAINSEGIIFAVHDAGGAPTVIVLGTVYNSATGSAEIDPVFPDVAATGASLLIGMCAVNANQASGPTMNGAGETSILAAGGGNGRTFVFKQAVAGAGNESFDITLASASRVICYQMTIAVAGVPAPTISDVNTTNTVTIEDTSFIITGTNFDNVAPKATAEIRQGANTFALTASAQTATTYTTAMPVLSGVSPKHGTATAYVINDDAQEDGQAITIAAEAATDYIDLSTLNADHSLWFDPSATLVSGDQVLWGVVVGGDETSVSINDDFTYDIADGVTSVSVRYWDQSTRTWSAYVAFPVVAGVVGAGSHHMPASPGAMGRMMGRG